MHSRHGLLMARRPELNNMRCTSVATDSQCCVLVALFVIEKDARRDISVRLSHTQTR
jgi:hypothetical protein